MPEATEYRAEVYNALKLYEALLKLCFAVTNRRVVSTEADNLYVFLELREALHELLTGIDPLLPDTLPADLLPQSISTMTEQQYLVLQGGFGVIKTYAKTIKAHGSPITTEVKRFMTDAEEILRGGSLASDILLSESEVSAYDAGTLSLIINGKRVIFDGAQEGYFVWAMFKQKLNTNTSWDLVYEAVNKEFGDAVVFKNGYESIRQAMNRVNRKIMRDVGTKNRFFTQKRRGFLRHYGPEAE